MNAMTSALAIAGVALPTKMECLWRIIKDYPGLTSNALAQRAKISTSNACSMLYQMSERGMVRSSTQVERRRTGHGMASRNVKIYFTARGMNEYELFPLPAAKAKGTSEIVVEIANEAQKIAVEPAVPKMSQSFAEIFMANHSTLINALNAIEPKMDLQNMQVSTLLQICAKHGVKISLS